MASSYEKKQKSPLLSLPGELRNKIYEYALGGNLISPFYLGDDDTVFFLRSAQYGNPQDQSTEEAWAKLFNLSKVCRQLYQETKLLPYKLNVFNICLGGAFGSFLSQLKDVNKKAITTVSFGFMSWVETDPIIYPCTVPKELEECTGLTTAISIITLDACQKKMVADFAKARGLKLVVESDGISDISWSMYDCLYEAMMKDAGMGEEDYDEEYPEEDYDEEF